MVVGRVWWGCPESPPSSAARRLRQYGMRAFFSRVRGELRECHTYHIVILIIVSIILERMCVARLFAQTNIWLQAGLRAHTATQLTRLLFFAPVLRIFMVDRRATKPSHSKGLL